MNVLFNDERRLREGWWIALFFVVLAAMLIPLVIVTKQRGAEVSLVSQAMLVVIASLLCQAFRRRPFSDVIGRFDVRWLAQLLVGTVIGAVLMLIPAAFLMIFAGMHFKVTGVALDIVLASLLPIIAAATTEELLFRGFIFQRMIDGLGAVPAQLLVAAFFVLTHSATMPGSVTSKTIATVNIFMASILFGLAFLRTRSLAMPLGLHIAANITQGSVLGFGVSGSRPLSILMPLPSSSPAWMTGGAFGLEASIPGLVAVTAVLCVIAKWKWNDPHLV